MRGSDLIPPLPKLALTREEVREKLDLKKLPHISEAVGQAIDAAFGDEGETPTGKGEAAAD